MMNKQEILSQLRDLAWHCESMTDPFDRDNIWRRDCEALVVAIKYVEKYMRDEEVERQPKTAHWIEDSESVFPLWCSRCNKFADEKTKYCPHCGAEMTEKTTEETEEARDED